MSAGFGVVSYFDFKPAQLETAADVVRVVDPVFKIRVQEIFDDICHVNQGPPVLRYFLVINRGQELLVRAVKEKEWICHGKKLRVFDVPGRKTESHIFKDAGLDANQISIDH